MRLLLGLTFCAATTAHALPSLSVPEDVWQSLQAPERAAIQEGYLVESVPVGSFGLILDNQGIDRSTPGTNGGSALGGAIAQAAYLDRALGGGSYSAKTQLGVAILGALIGSGLDQPAQASYQFRYAIKMMDGSIKYHDITSPDPFRHPAGACVMLPQVSMAANQNLCITTAQALREKIAKTASAETTMPASLGDMKPGGPTTPAQATEMQGSVSCKVGSVAPVVTTLEKCNLINGRILND